MRPRARLPSMRFRLRTLMMVLTLTPPLLAWCWANRVEAMIILPILGFLGLMALYAATLACDADATS